jgi:hypothetical protein
MHAYAEDLLEYFGGPVLILKYEEEKNSTLPLNNLRIFT